MVMDFLAPGKEYDASLGPVVRAAQVPLGISVFVVCALEGGGSNRRGDPRLQRQTSDNLRRSAGFTQTSHRSVSHGYEV